MTSGPVSPAVRLAAKAESSWRDAFDRRLGGLAVSGFAQAEHRHQTVAQRGGGLGRHQFFRLAEQRPPLRVADLDVTAAELGQDRPTDLAGLRAGVLGREVLGAERDTGSGQHVSHSRQRREGRQEEQAGARRRSLSSHRPDRPAPVQRLGVTEVHLQTDADDHQMVTLLTVWSASFARSLNKCVIGLVLLGSSSDKQISGP